MLSTNREGIDTHSCIGAMGVGWCGEGRVGDQAHNGPLGHFFLRTVPCKGGLAW